VRLWKLLGVKVSNSLLLDDAGNGTDDEEDVAEEHDNVCHCSVNRFIVSTLSTWADDGGMGGRKITYFE
jgi:hypothetical protein